MKRFIVHSATLATMLCALALPVSASAAGIPDNKVVVVRIKAIDGRDAAASSVKVNRSEQFMAGARYHVSKSAVSNLDGVRTLVLVERRTDSVAGGELTQTLKMEAMGVNGDVFNVTGTDGKSVSYAVDVLNDGSVDLLGPKDRIVVRQGEYQIWKIQSAQLVSRDRINLY